MNTFESLNMLSMMPTPQKQQQSEEDETEDEEVKMHCIGGDQSHQDSDINSDSGGEEGDSSEIEHENGKERRNGIVTFFRGNTEKISVLRPIAERPSQKLQSDTDSNSESASSQSSVVSSTPSMGARGLAISFGDSNDEESSSEEGDAEDTDSERALPMQAPDDDSGWHGLNSSPETDDQTNDSQNGKAELHVKRVLSLGALSSQDDLASSIHKRLRRGEEDGSSDCNGPSSVVDVELQTSTTDTDCDTNGQQHAATMGNSIVLAKQQINSDEFLQDETLLDELRNPSSDERPSSPIPLLTPPESPQPTATTESELEWPSNLVVDSAMMKVAAMTRPLSLMSLRDVDDSDDHVEENDLRNTDATALAPLMRSISVKCKYQGEV